MVLHFVVQCLRDPLIYCLIIRKSCFLAPNSLTVLSYDPLNSIQAFLFMVWHLVVQFYEDLYTYTLLTGIMSGHEMSTDNDHTVNKLIFIPLSDYKLFVVM